MFSQVSVCLWGGGEYLWSHVWGDVGQGMGVSGLYVRGWVLTLPGMGYNRIRSVSGKYASYWNTFLFDDVLK